MRSSEEEDEDGGEIDADFVEALTKIKNKAPEIYKVSRRVASLLRREFWELVP